MFPLVRITGDIALIWAQVTNYHVQCGQEKMFFKILPRFSEICKNMGGRGSHISVHLQTINTEPCFLIGISLLQNISLQLETFPVSEHQPVIIFNLKLAKFEAGDK